MCVNVFNSSIKEDVEEEEEYEEEDGDEDEREASNQEEEEDSKKKKESQPVGGYSLLEGREDEAPDACSSCSSDLSFGGSSSGSFFFLFEI